MRNITGSNRVAALFMLMSLACCGATAQENVIRGAIRDAAGGPVQNASVQLLKLNDSSLVKMVLSDSSGKYYFKNISEGEYLISASYTGLEQIFTKAFNIHSGAEQINQEVLHFGNAEIQLKDVTVSVRKPMIEQKIDRTVINVKNSITDAGGSALDVLGKSPGVSINRQDNSITINGKSGVSVMINGKMTYMPADALVQFLAGIPAGNIEKIELVTMPPAKYDASGNGGYINIILINNPYTGFNGSYFLTAGYGYRALGAGGMNFNYRSSKLNLFGNYSFDHNHTIQTSTAFTRFTRDGNIITNSTFSDRDATQEVHNARIGMDYQLNSSTIAGVMLSGYNSRWSMVARNGATISKNNSPDTIISFVDNPEINLWQNIMANLNFQHIFKPGKILYIDANYIYYKDDNPNTYSADYYDNLKEFLYHEDLKGEKVTPIHFQVYSCDYAAPVGKKVNMEVGAKVSMSNFINDVSVNKITQGIQIPDTGLSAKYLLNENISAAYTSFTMTLNSKISITAGLRYEYTGSDLGSAKTPDMADRRYGEFFPTFYFSDKFNRDNSFSFSYSRRITRPAFNDLAPFTIFFDPKTFYSGNPALLPAIANTLQAGYGFKNYNFTLSYTYETNTIDNFYFQTKNVDTVTGIVYLSTRNFKYQQYLSAGFSLPFSVNKWWSMQNNVNLNWRRINTEFDKAQLLFQYFDFSLNSTQRFALPGDFSIELTALYSSASYVGTAKRQPYYQLDAGLQKKFGNKRDILRFAANDIFNSGADYRFGETLPVTGIIVNRSFNFQLVAYRLTFTHSFGNNALKAKTERSTGAEDELRRVHN